MVWLRSWRVAAAGLLVAVLACLSTPVAADQTVQVIRSADQDDVPIDRKLLLSVYIGRVTAWPDGKPLRVFTLTDDHPLHVQFCREMLGTYPYVLRNAWNKLVYTGTGFAPTLVASEQEMRRRVDQTPGAIGYVRATQAGFRQQQTIGAWTTQAYGASNE